MRQVARIAVCGVFLGVVGSACSVSTAAVQVRLNTPAFGTTGGNLFNCSTPDQPANRHALTTDTVGCQPNQNPDGSFTTTPITVTKQVGCGDGHGALVVVTCAGTGTGTEVSGTVTLSLTSGCSDTTIGADPQAFAFQNLAPGDVQTSPAPLDSCSVFGNLCGTSNACAFNSFAAQIAVTNESR